MSDQKAFPFDYDERELKEELQKRANALRPRDASSAQVDVPFVQLGIVELQGRITSKLTNIVEAQSQTSHKMLAMTEELVNSTNKMLMISKRALWVAIIACGMSFFAIIFPSVQGYLAHHLK